MSARTARTAALFATVVAGFAALAVLLMPGTAAAVTEDPTRSPVVVAAVGSGQDITPAQAEGIITAAHLVCEGITAGVPMGTMTGTLRDLGYSLTEAVAIENAALNKLC